MFWSPLPHFHYNFFIPRNINILCHFQFPVNIRPVLHTSTLGCLDLEYDSGGNPKPIFLNRRTAKDPKFSSHSLSFLVHPQEVFSRVPTLGGGFLAAAKVDNVMLLERGRSGRRFSVWRTGPRVRFANATLPPLPSTIVDSCSQLSISPKKQLSGMCRDTVIFFTSYECKQQIRPSGLIRWASLL